METTSDEKETEDPDYESVSNERKREQASLSTRQKDAKEQAIQKINNIIRQQFGFEIHLKEREIDVIHDRISQAKAMLDRLRACVLAKYYGTSELKRNRTSDRLDRGEIGSTKKSTRSRVKQAGFPTTETQSATKGTSPCKSETSDSLEAKKLTVRTETLVNGNLVNCEFKKKSFETRSGQGNNNTILLAEEREKLMAPSSDDVNLTKTLREQLQISTSPFIHQNHDETSKQSSCKISRNGVKTDAIKQCSLNAEPVSVTCSGSRFYLKKRIIVGNTSKYIPVDSREDNDKSTHKWMMYVRGPPEDPPIDRFIKKVWFFLHPSYRPNDIVEVNKPPFHLTRRGWGEFPVRVQLHFVDPRNKRVDIIHELKLDRTYTGLQTLGSETVVDLELDRRTFEDNCIPYTLSSTSIEESFATNLITVSTNSSRGNYSDNVDRGPANPLGNKDQADKLCTVNSQTNFDNSAQYLPPLKKLKLESPISVVHSGVSSVSSTPLNSLPASRCSSPETVSNSQDEQSSLSDEILELLRLAVKEHPLIHHERNVVKYPYCASSAKQFQSWNIGKRRACEWQRAAAIRRDLCKSVPSCKLSTKDVFIWCRRFGYSPSDKVAVSENVSFCKLCGACLPEVSSEEVETHRCEEHHFTSLTASSRFLSEVGEKEEYLPDVPRASEECEDVEIDVVGSLPENRTVEPRESGPALYLSAVTPEQEWIRDTCSDIGIKLKTVSIDGVHLHVIESLLLAACSRFAEDILRQSWAFATDQTTSYGCRLVTPSHVYKAICSLPSCDFLSNAYLGEDLFTGDK